MKLCAAPQYTLPEYEWVSDGEGLLFYKFKPLTDIAVLCEMKWHYLLCVVLILSKMAFILSVTPFCHSASQSELEKKVYGEEYGMLCGYKVLQ